MAQRITKKALFFASIVLMGILGLIQNIFIDNFSKSKSAFRQEEASNLPNLIDAVHADIPPDPVAAAPSGDGDGGDGSNGL